LIEVCVPFSTVNAVNAWVKTPLKQIVKNMPKDTGRNTFASVFLFSRNLTSLTFAATSPGSLHLSHTSSWI